MVAINETTLQDIERFKAQIGWSWNMIGDRIGVGILQMTKIRALKLGVTDAQYNYLATVAAAVSAIPLPVDEKSNPPQYEAPAQPAAAAPSSIVHDMGTQLKVMLLEDIATKLAEEYHDLARVDGIGADELLGARYAIGRMADKFGVGAEVRALLREPRTAPSALPSMFEVKGPEINSGPTSAKDFYQRAPFENEPGTF